MTKIRILDDSTINKIAAGEVIENPASVVKELMENALDAKASEVRVETKAGGRGTIKIIDNGCGMSADDLILSIERHATSKLREVDELNSLMTLGFRGEALPSIASVSRMKIHSAERDGAGHVLEIEGGKMGKITPCPRRQGTTIEVNSLFFNVPVRKKFQRSLNWDISEIGRLLKLFTLIHSNVGFTWINDGEQQFTFSQQGEMKERIQALLGEEFSACSLPVEHSRPQIELRGQISQPLFHRPNRTGQYLFINGRSVISPFISSQVLESYGTRLPQHRFPLFFLDLKIPPSWIDVNVHPQKKEVRLRKESELSAFILEAIGHALEKKEGDFLITSPPEEQNFSSLFFSQHIEQKERPKEDREIFLTSLDKIARDEPLFAAEREMEYRCEARDLFSKTVAIIGRVQNHFFLQEEGGVRVVHVLRAMERVIYDELNEPKKRPAMQTLLLPVQLTLTASERHLLMEHLETLNEKGIGIRYFGGETFIVDAIPSILEAHEIKELIGGYLHAGKLPLDMGKCLNRSHVSLEGGKAVIEKLFACKNGEFTPNGKRIHYLIDEHELKKKFL